MGQEHTPASSKDRPLQSLRCEDLAVTRPRPSLLVSTGAFFGEPLSEAFRSIAEAGFEAVEVMVTKEPATQSADEIAALSSEYGLGVRAVHAPFLLVSRRVFGTDPVPKIERTVRLAELVGATTVVVHPPYRWQTDYRRWLTQSLPSYTKASGVDVAVENMFPLRTRAGLGVTFHSHQGIENLERFEHVVLDTSHAAVAGLDLVDTATRLGPRLVHVHLSNNAGRGWDTHATIDEGVLDLRGFLGRLGQSDYAGNVSLELDLRKFLTRPGTVEKLLVRQRELMETWIGRRRDDVPPPSAPRETHTT
jgi:sugar phosphate isomerase/epimerase